MMGEERGAEHRARRRVGGMRVGLGTQKAAVAERR